MASSSVAASRLTRTEGEWRFKTFLTALNESAHVVVTLQECQWNLTWCEDFTSLNLL